MAVNNYIQRMTEKKFVEDSFLNQLENMVDGPKWSIVKLDNEQIPADTDRTYFSEVILPAKLKEGLQKINPWLEVDQIDDLLTRITNLHKTTLLENNKDVLQILLEGTSAAENRKTGAQHPTVRYIDFENPTNNNYTAVSQFKIRVTGTEKHIYPDILLFVNGLPLVVIECKSPKADEPIDEAIDQMLRYSGQRGYDKEGVPALFWYNQLLIATCRDTAMFGTITTHGKKHFYRWTDPYPKNLDDLEHGLSSPNDQQRLIQGMLWPQNLLSILKTFTIFSATDGGKIIKVVGRYQQFRSVHKTLHRLLTGKNRRERGGIVWHTQGSGKSLTMVFLIREMYHHPTLQEYKIILLTDRRQLDQQITETAEHAGYHISNPQNIAELKTAIRSSNSEIVSCMIHKFQERDMQQVFPVLNTSEKILILTDEAHRTQYTLLGANLDQAMPNATRIAFTGTPIEKTESTFGEYIDKYTMRQAIDDGVTLKIIYEGRTHEALVNDRTGMDRRFTDVFSDYNVVERFQILGYGSRRAYLEAWDVIKEKAKDMLRHYVEHVFSNGFKAQVVATSKEAAHRYKTAFDEALPELIAELSLNNEYAINIDKLSRLEISAILSFAHNDEPHLQQYGNSALQKQQIAGFKMPFGKVEEKDGQKINGNLGILIVVDMLLTGFDAPIEQVLYIDKIIIAHNLLQAIARVNRVGPEDKEVGFVVDYVGIGDHLGLALDMYDEKEKKDILACLGDESQLLVDLATSAQNVKDLLQGWSLDGSDDYDAFFDFFYDEDQRHEYIKVFQAFTSAMNQVLPRKEALKYLPEFLYYIEINATAGKHLRDSRLSMKGVPRKLRAIADEYLMTRGIDVKVEPISIMDENFINEVGMRNRSKTKAAEIEHAMRHHIDINIDDDPDLYASFATAIEDILERFAGNWEVIYQKLEELRRKLKDQEKEPTYGLHKKKQMPFFRILKNELYADQEISEENISILVALTKEIVEYLHVELRFTGFWRNNIAQSRLKGEVMKLLISADFVKLPGMFERRNELTSRIMETARRKTELLSA